MTTTVISIALALAAGATAQCPNCGQNHHRGGRILGPGPGNGFGFPNDQPDGYGWVDYGTWLPIREDRTAEYYFPRYYAVPPQQAFIPTYYNPYITRGQRYIAFAGAGGSHAMGGPPIASAALPTHPYQDTLGTGARVTVPPFTGRVESTPVNTGGTGLTP